MGQEESTNINLKGYGKTTEVAYLNLLQNLKKSHVDVSDKIKVPGFPKVILMNNNYYGINFWKINDGERKGESYANLENQPIDARIVAASLIKE